MSWATKKTKIPDDCPDRVEFPGLPDDCTNRKNRGALRHEHTLCTRANCPYVKEGTPYRNPINDQR
jgi:hypothetical protein